ncbi:MAG: hypothetical protein Q9160_000917 [Pyrenula sp. 1 TL-2023]
MHRGVVWLDLIAAFPSQDHLIKDCTAHLSLEYLEGTAEETNKRIHGQQIGVLEKVWAQNSAPSYLMWNGRDGSNMHDAEDIPNKNSSAEVKDIDENTFIVVVGDSFETSSPRTRKLIYDVYWTVIRAKKDKPLTSEEEKEKKAHNEAMEAYWKEQETKAPVKA